MFSVQASERINDYAAYVKHGQEMGEGTTLGRHRMARYKESRREDRNEERDDRQVTSHID